MSAKKMEIAVPARYQSINFGICRTNVPAPDNIVVYERHKINPKAGFFHQDGGFFLIYCIDGKGTICLDEDYFDFKPGNILPVFPWQMHCYLNLELPRRWIFVRAKWEPPESIYRLRNHLMTIHPDEITVIRKMVDIWNDCNAEAAAWKAEYLSAMMSTLIYSIFSRNQGRELVPAASSENHRLVERINCYIYQHLGKPFNIQLMSEGLGFSPNYLGSVFRKKYFITLEAYIKNLRIDYAKKQLAGTALSIGEIASELGFASLYSFSNCFHRVTGVSPSKYRKEVRNSTSHSSLYQTE